MSSTVRHPFFARLYSRVIAPGIAKQGGDDLRRRALAGLSGTVVEVGAGDGANFALYPEEVKRLVAVEPEAYLRTKAAARAGERIELRDAVATDLPLGDGEADAVVFTLVLCSVEQAGALAEARRVLRDGGQLRFLEHVRAQEPGIRRLQQNLDRTVWPLLGGGCRLSRDTETAIRQAGFSISELDRFHFPEGARGPSSTVIIGSAVPALDTEARMSR